MHAYTNTHTHTKYSYHLYTSTHDVYTHTYSLFIAYRFLPQNSNSRAGVTRSSLRWWDPMLVCRGLIYCPPAWASMPRRQYRELFPCLRWNNLKSKGLGLIRSTGLQVYRSIEETWDKWWGWEIPGRVWTGLLKRQEIRGEGERYQEGFDFDTWHLPLDIWYLIIGILQTVIVGNTDGRYRQTLIDRW